MVRVSCTSLSYTNKAVYELNINRRFCKFSNTFKNAISVKWIEMGAPCACDEVGGGLGFEAVVVIGAVFLESPFWPFGVELVVHFSYIFSSCFCVIHPGGHIPNFLFSQKKSRFSMLAKCKVCTVWPGLQGFPYTRYAFKVWIAARLEPHITG